MAVALLMAGVLVVLPLVFIAWLAFRPDPSAFGFAAQAVGTGLALLALALIGTWAMPPWWAPYVYGALWLVALVARFWRQGRHFARRFPDRLSGWINMAVIGGVGLWFSVLSLQALQGRARPAAEAVDIAFPMKNGAYLVAHGGSRGIVNAHLKTLDAVSRSAGAYRGQSYAIDILKVDGLDLKSRGWQPEELEAYAIFGEPVYAPCARTVIGSRDGLPDNRIGEMDLAIREGNHILLDCGGYALLFAHFRKGSVRAKTGDRISAGALLGEAGNSGASTEPHLHLHAQKIGTPEAPFAADPIPFTVGGRYLVRNDLVRAGK